MSNVRERVLSFTPIETVPLPRPLNRFGTAFPTALADAYATAYAPRRGVVLDPLAHPWSAADAVEAADRRGIAKSREPLGEWARAVVALAPPLDEVLAAFERVADSALVGTPHRVAMRELYGSRCATCHGPVVVEAFLWERDAPVPSKKAFRCSVCARDGRALLIEGVDTDDEERTRRLEPRGMAYWQFVERFGSDPAAQALGETVAALYTPRNITALMATLRAVETSVGDPAAQGLLKLCLLESIVAGSRLNAVAGHGAPLRIDKGRARRGHASQTREVNIWLEYERTVRELVAWLAQYDNHRGASPPENPPRRRSALLLDPGDADLVMCQAPVEDTLGGWSTVASALLLGAKTLRPMDTGEGRLAARERLLRTLRAALIEAHRVSRPEAAAVVYVPHADAATIAACVLAGAGAGYRLRAILYQRDAHAGAYGSPAAAVCDFDRDVPLLRDQGSADASLIENAIRTGVREAVLARGEPVREDVAAVAALQSLAAKGLLVPIALARAGGVSELELFLDHFKSALADGRRTGVTRVPRGDDADDVAYAVTEAPDATPLGDRVEWAVWGLLSSAREVDTRSLLRRVYALFRGIETPDRELVERCVAAYATQTDDGRWRLQGQDALVARQASQAQVLAELIDTGHRLGFKVHVGRDVERRALPTTHAERGRVLSDLVSEVERTSGASRFVRGAAEAVDFVDCVWYDRGHMVFLWQVDWTARIHRSIVALGEAIPDDDRVFRFLAVADERTSLVHEKLRRSPALAEVVRRRGWRFVKWDPLRKWLGDAQSGLDGLEAVLGLEPAVEQSGQQLAFRW
ncbi:MAG TPA: hypothetical protein VFQ66_04315 [Candidatus Limnocylindria bacterium]|nr:hypothetical protein [Candidatus Limnocylindria bacterium]